jgi:hypothetical protein
VSEVVTGALKRCKRVSDSSTCLNAHEKQLLTQKNFYPIAELQFLNCRKQVAALLLFELI